MKKYRSMFLLLFLWEVFGLVLPTQTSFIPIPHQILVALIDQFRHLDIYIDILSSLQKVLVGFSLASVLGILGGLLSGYLINFGKQLRPIVEILRPIPPIAYIPIAILLFGLGNMPAYFIVFIGAFFPIFTSTYLGVTNLPRVYKDVVSSFELSKYTYLSRILFPFSLQNIFTGLKIGMGTAWMSVIAAELIGGESGLGYFIQINRLLLRTDNILVGMIVIGLIGYMLNELISSIEYKIVRWKK